MANKDFNLTLKMRAEFAQAQAALKGAKDNIGKIGGELDRVNKLGITTRGMFVAVGVAAAAVAAVGVATLRKYIANTIEAEKVQAQLASRIRDTAGAAGRSLAQLNDQADKLSKQTIFDDEAVGEVQAMLLTFREIKDVRFDQATAAVLDLATAMGTDAKSASVQLGKALNDPILGVTALSRMGVQFTEDQKKVIKVMVETGDVAGAQAVILDELSGQMGTAAEAARDTLGGALQALSNSFDNLLEGDVADGGLRGARDAVEALNDTLNDPATKEGFDTLITGALTALSALAKFAAGTASVAKFIGEEIASRAHGPAIGDAVRIDRELANEQRNYAAVVKNLGADDREAKRIAKRIADLKGMAKATSDAALEAQRLASVKAPVIDTKLSDPAAIAAARAAAEAAEAAKKAGKGKKATDPDDAGRKRIASLQEEIALLGTLAAGETKVTDAAKLRYDITEGELAKISPALKKQLTDLQDVIDAKNADIEAEIARKKALEETTEAYQDLRDELRTPTEIALENAIEQVDRLNAAFKEGLLNKQAYDDAAGRIASGAFDKAPKFSGLSPEIGGPFSELAKINEAREELAKWHEEKLEMLTELRARESELNAQWDAQELELTAQHQAALRQLDAAQTQVMLAGASAMFGNLADIAKTFGGEQSKTYKALFALSKAFAIAQSAIALAQNVAEASKIGFPQNIPMIAGAFAQGASIVAMLAGAQFTGGGGYAEGGYTGPGGKYQPAGTVHKGEGVLSQKDIAALGGPSAFFDLRKAIQDGSMRERLYGWAGYADGGLVTPGAPRMAEPNWASFPQGSLTVPRPQVNQRNYLLLDSEEVGRAVAESSGFETNVLKVLANNPRALQGNF